MAVMLVRSRHSRVTRFTLNGLKKYPQNSEATVKLVSKDTACHMTPGGGNAAVTLGNQSL